MVKRSRQRQRGIPRGVQRHRIRASDEDEDSDGLSALLSNRQRLRISKCARKCWNSLLKICTSFCLIPIEVSESSGSCKLSPIWKRGLHYSIAVVYGGIAVYKFWKTAQRAMFVGPDLITYMCACSFIVVFIAGCCTSGTTWLSGRICDVINSWKSLFRFLEVEAGIRKTQFDDVAGNMEVIFLFIIVHMCGLNASFFSLVGDIPTSVLPTLESLGWVCGRGDSEVSRIVWRIAFLPLEILTLLPPMLATGVSAMAVMMGLGVFKLYANEVKKIAINDMQSWNKVYQLYRTLQLYNMFLMNWMKIVDVVALASACCGVVLLLYVTIRPSDLPMLVYIWFPIVAILLMITLTWIFYDSVIIKRTAEAVAGNLEAAIKSPFMRHQTMKQRWCARRLKSLRQMHLVLGEFTEMTLEVPMDIWDEVFSQLVFLLSL